MVLHQSECWSHPEGNRPVWLGKALRINDVDKQGNTLINIVQNFVSDETIICDDRDPPWINKEIKKLIEQKKQFYKQFIRSDKTLLYINQFKALYDKLGFLIEKSKSNIIQSCLVI